MIVWNRQRKGVLIFFLERGKWEWGGEIRRIGCCAGGLRDAGMGVQKVVQGGCTPGGDPWGGGVRHGVLPLITNPFRCAEGGGFRGGRANLSECNTPFLFLFCIPLSDRG